MFFILSSSIYTLLLIHTTETFWIFKMADDDDVEALLEAPYKKEVCQIFWEH